MYQVISDHCVHMLKLCNLLCRVLNLFLALFVFVQVLAKSEFVIKNGNR